MNSVKGGVGLLFFCFFALTTLRVAFNVFAKSKTQELSWEFKRIGESGLDDVVLFNCEVPGLILFGEKGVRGGEGDLALLCCCSSLLLLLGDGGVRVLFLFLDRVGVGVGAVVSISSISCNGSLKSLFGYSDPRFVGFLGVDVFWSFPWLSFSLAALIMRPGMGVVLLVSKLGGWGDVWPPASGLSDLSWVRVGSGW